MGGKLKSVASAAEQRTACTAAETLHCQPVAGEEVETNQSAMAEYSLKAGQQSLSTTDSSLAGMAGETDQKSTLAGGCVRPAGSERC